MTLEPNPAASSDPKSPVSSAEDQRSERSELAHVLFLDIVAYSKLRVDKQFEVLDALNSIIAATSQFRRAQGEHKLLLLPTGDGAAIVFFDCTSADPVNCAFEIARAIKEKPEIKLRMGVNSGPVQRITDLNGKVNVAGAGINYAQRAMDCGGINHILLTKAAAEFLVESSAYWSERIHEIGPYEVKNKIVIILYNAYTETLGNPEPPVKGRPVKGTSWKIPEAFKRQYWIALVSLSLLLVGIFIFLNVIAMAGLMDPLPSSMALSVTGITPPGLSGLYYPRISPDKQWIAYASRANGKWDIYIQRFDKNGLIGAPLNLTSARDQNSTQPEFSPDGTKIAFSSKAEPVFSPDGKLKHLVSNDNTDGIFVIDRATGGITQYTYEGGYNPSWSPDGKQIAYANESVIRPDDRLTSTSELRVFNIDDKSDTTVYNGDAVQPVWSPNGKRLAFWYAGDSGQRDIATISLDGNPGDTRRVPVITDSYVDWSPSWSRDGYLYFSSNRGGGQQFHIWRVQVDESTGEVHGKPEQINGPSGDSEHLSFSKDGQQLVFIQSTLTVSLYHADFDPVHSLAKPPVNFITSQSATRPDLSPDGQWLAYNTAGAGQANVFIARSDGTGTPQNVLEESFTDQGPRWAPDGKRLAFFSNRKGSWQLYAMNPRTGSVNQLTSGSGDKFKGYLYPVWSPDDRIAFTRRGVNTSNIESQIARYDTSGQLQSKSLPRLRDFESFTAWSWSPDGQTIAGYLQGKDGDFAGIAVYKVAEQSFERLTHFGSDPVWLNDNHRLLFNYNGGIYLVDEKAADREAKVLRVVDLPEPGEVARRGFAISKDNRTIFFSRQVVQSTLSAGHIDNPETRVSRLLELFKHWRDR